MSGHFEFNTHLATIGKRMDQSCDLCGELIETAEHIVYHCPAHNSRRYRYIGDYIISYQHIISLHPKDILDYITAEHYQERNS